MISINGHILENRYTTAQWALISDPLPDRVWGHEIDASGNPVGSKMGDGIHLWSSLPYWYQNDAAQYKVKIAAGTTIPFNVLKATANLGLRPKASFLIPRPGSSVKLTGLGTSGMYIEPIYSSSAYTTIVSVDVYGNDDGTGKFNEDTYVTIY